MGTSSSSSPGSSSPRGRNREGRRVSESLSPPVAPGATELLNRQGAVSPSSQITYRPIPSGLGHQSYSADPYRSNGSGMASDLLPSSGSKTPLSQLPRSNAPSIGRGASGDSISSISSNSSSTTSISGRLLPPSIPEEDERSKLESPTSDTSSRASTLAAPDTQSRSESATPRADPKIIRVKTGYSTPQSKGGNSLQDSAPAPPSPRSKANELVASARSIIGSIFNGATA